jgi:DNA-binding response OmpR family regulator
VDVVRVLLVEDSPRVAHAVGAGLRERSVSVVVAGTVRAANDAFAEQQFDVAVVDIGLPDGSGLAWCRDARSAGSQIPILLLTARNEVADRVAGLQAGADDYMAKPFAMEELVARLHALARRGPRLTESIRTFGPIVVDVGRRVVTAESERVVLTAREFDIVALLAWSDGRAIARTEILETVWGSATDSGAASLEVLVARIRRKLADRGVRDAIRTIREVGYAWAIEGTK